MTEKVFTGGHFSSGTRVIQLLLKQFYNIGTFKEDTYDYEEGFSIRPTFAERVLMGERPEFKPPEAYISLKNPEFMFCFPYLKELYPESKTILVVRNGLDQILTDNQAMIWKFGQYFDLQESDYFRRKMEFWNKAYKKAIEGNPDSIVRLEDLVNDTKKTVKKIVRLLDIPYPHTDMIVEPSSMERYKFNHIIKDYPENNEHYYEAHRAEELYKVGKEMMDYFGYDI